MINKKLFFQNKKVGFLLGAVLLAALTESAVYAGDLHVGIVVSPPVVVVAPPVVVTPVVVVQDDYVYYPDYAVYYNSHRHQYAYLQGGAWVFAAAPQGVSVDVLLASPSVRMDWHDSPEHHHAEMVKKYPRNWKSSDVHHDHKEAVKAAAPDNNRKDRDKH
jgi:hypothetical protein